MTDASNQQPRAARRPEEYLRDAEILQLAARIAVWHNHQHERALSLDSDWCRCGNRWPCPEIERDAQIAAQARSQALEDAAELLRQEVGCMSKNAPSRRSLHRSIDRIKALQPQPASPAEPQAESVKGDG